jgi:hypothetical protein
MKGKGIATRLVVLSLLGISSTISGCYTPPLVEQPKDLPDLIHKDVTQIVIRGDSQLLKLYHTKILESKRLKNLFEQKNIYWFSQERKLVYMFETLILANQENTIGFPVDVFYRTLVETTLPRFTGTANEDSKPLEMSTAIHANYTCRPYNCAGQQGSKGVVPPCVC